jgi:hypothetical protein
MAFTVQDALPNPKGLLAAANAEARPRIAVAGPHFWQKSGPTTAVGTSSGCRPEFECRWGQELSLLLVVQTGSGAHTTSSPMSIGGKAAGT